TLHTARSHWKIHRLLKTRVDGLSLNKPAWRAVVPGCEPITLGTQPLIKAVDQEWALSPKHINVPVSTLGNMERLVLLKLNLFNWKTVLSNTAHGLTIGTSSSLHLFLKIYG
ncbi:unnamed protein product, partial [Meganyctiphanes norvegica]